LGNLSQAGIRELAFADNILQVSLWFDALEVTPHHADTAGSLPMHHPDPFDRLLIAQAQIEGLVLVTQDRQLLPYGVPILGVSA
jgi:PIN domain nuclease of toxin-antitoxin system